MMGFTKVAQFGVLSVVFTFGHAQLQCGYSSIETLAAGGRKGVAYIPYNVCKSKLFGGSPPAAVAIVLHCWGCDGDTEVRRWGGSAESLNVALVAPHGIGGGYNAIECCGPAVTDHLDDVKVAALLAQELINRLKMAQSPNPDLSLDKVFMLGISNGGFLASYAATAYLQYPPPGKTAYHWQPAGIATIAGHISQLPDSHSAPGLPTPVWIHHGTKDKLVSVDGCCAQHQCCCGIFSTQTCVGAIGQFEWWLQRNRCNASEPLVITETVSSDQSAYIQAARCSRGIGCLAETRLCLYTGFDHPDMLKLRPLPLQTMQMLLSSPRKVSSNGGLIFQEKAIVPGAKYDTSDGEAKALVSKKHAIQAFLLSFSVFTVFSLLLLRWRRQSKPSRTPMNLLSDESYFSVTESSDTIVETATST